MDTLLCVLRASLCHQLGMLDLSFGVAKEARVNIMTEDGEGEKWDRRIMVLSSQHQALFFWPGTRKYPKGPVARVWRLHVLVLWFGRGLAIKLGVCVCVCVCVVTPVHRQLDMKSIISVRPFMKFQVEGFVWHLEATQGRHLYTVVTTRKDRDEWVRICMPWSPARSAPDLLPRGVIGAPHSSTGWRERLREDSAELHEDGEGAQRSSPGSHVARAHHSLPSMLLFYTEPQANVNADGQVSTGCVGHCQASTSSCMPCPFRVQAVWVTAPARDRQQVVKATCASTIEQGRK